MDNLYIQTLKLGFDNPHGISFNEVVEKLNIDLTDKNFKSSYIFWFYDNFYNQKVEYKISLYRLERSYSFQEIGGMNIEEIDKFNKDKSFIKGDSVNKYIDYLELERTRESAKQASWFATGSIIIAILAVILPYLISPDEITFNGKLALVGIILSLFSFGYSIFINLNIKSKTKKQKLSFWPYTIIFLVSGIILAGFIIGNFNMLEIDISNFTEGLLVVPVFVVIIGKIIKKYRSQ